VHVKIQYTVVIFIYKNKNIKQYFSKFTRLYNTIIRTYAGSVSTKHAIPIALAIYTENVTCCTGSNLSNLLLTKISTKIQHINTLSY